MLGLSSNHGNHFSGYIEKKKPGLVFASYKKEWCIVSFTHGTFIRKEAQNSTENIQVIPLSAIKNVNKKGKNIFELQLTEGAPIAYRCAKEVDTLEWIDKISNPHRHSNPIPSPTAIPSTKTSHSESKEDKARNGSGYDNSQALNKRDTVGSTSASTSSAHDNDKSNGAMPQGVPIEALSATRNALMGEIKTRSRVALSMDLSDSSKKETVLHDNTVFMGKARNFALSTSKQFQQSFREKGSGVDRSSMRIDAGSNGGDTTVDGNNVNEPSRNRQAVMPMYLLEENVDASRYEKDDAVRKRLKDVLERALDDFLGGNLVYELDLADVIDLMYSVRLKQGEAVVQQGEPTSCMYVVESGKMGVYTQDFVNRPPEFVEEKKPGDFFGALTLLYNQPGPFTVKALRESALWALPRAKFHEVISQAARRRAGKKIRLLESVPLIADNLEKTSIIELADAMSSRTYKDGEIILNAGEELKNLYFIADGEVSMVVSGTTTSIGELSKGEAFGEWALLDIGAKSDVSLVVKSEATIMSLHLAEVEELVGPLRDYVTKRWAEERSGDFFFNGNDNRVGTQFDTRNPVSQAPQTIVQPNLPSADKANNAAAAASATTTPLAAVSETQPLVISEEEKQQVIAVAIEQAKKRTTAAAARKTKGGETPSSPSKSAKPLPAIKETTTSEKPAPTPATPPKEAASAKEKEKAAAAEKKKLEEEAAADRKRKEEEERRRKEQEEEENDNRQKGADETDSDGEGGGMDDEEESLDLPFTKCQPLRPELTLSMITPCALLGRGNFGRVHLSRNETNHSEIFALKVLARHFIVANGWEVLVENERNAMLELSTMTKSPFLLKLYNSYCDKKNIYLLLELCQGGDLYNLLRVTKGNRFSEDNARYYMACVTVGLEAMHSRKIIYRDLKPENLMLDQSGMVKIADFGLAKKTIRTYTVCGTPDYMAPEVIVSRGHAAAVDWWALGVLLYEMVGAATPFTGKEAVDVYDSILDHVEENDLRWPAVPFSANAKNLITRLLHPKKTKRLGIVHPGVDGVKKHPFFNGFDWDKLLKLEITPPTKPNFVDMTKYTTGNSYKTYNSKIKDNPDDNSGWKLDF